MIPNNIKKFYILVLTIVATLLYLPAVNANTIKSPITLLQEVSTGLFAELARNESAVRNNIRKVEAIINQRLMPHADLEEMAVWLTGRRIWAEAPAQQKSNFLAAFKSLMIRTYGSALIDYAHDKITFPTQNVDLSHARVEVHGLIYRPSGNIRIRFRLKKHDTGWKVYDLEVEGVSILRGFMAQFSNDIKTNGLTYVTNQINQHNKG